MKKSKALRIRQIIEQSMDGTIDDATALEAPNLFQLWSGNSVQYKKDIRVRFTDGNLYRCLTEHTSQPTWDPVSAPGLWAKVLIPDENIIPDWEQPDSTNGYSYGDKVRHNGIIWISIYEGSNVWEPGAAGTENLWKKYEEDPSTEEENTGLESGGDSTEGDDEGTDDNSGTSDGGSNSGEDSGSTDSGEEISAWVQPDATNGYSIGDKVTHNGSVWISKIDNNVHEPSAAAWAAWDQVV